MVRFTLVSFTALSVVLGVIQADVIVVGVSTERGVMEQEREREDPATNSFPDACTTTRGLGTGDRNTENCKYSPKALRSHFAL